MNPFGLTFHHFGLSVRVFEQARRFLEGSGYTVTTAVFDPQQGVNLAMAENPTMPKVEIIWPAAETSSSLEKMVRKHPGGVIYHACYVAESLERSLAAMAAADLNPVCMSAAKPAVLFGLTPVAFYTIPGMGLVELIDGEPGPPVASALIPF
jgi:hypothetical protein